jgi:Flp pilus assembly pilin Flp
MHGASGTKEGGVVLLTLAARVQGLWFQLRGGFKDETGAVATEYVLLLVFIAVVIVGAATAFGIALSDRYRVACAPLSAAC